MMNWIKKHDEFLAVVLALAIGLSLGFGINWPPANPQAQVSK